VCKAGKCVVGGPATPRQVFGDCSATVCTNDVPDERPDPTDVPITACVTWTCRTGTDGKLYAEGKAKPDGTPCELGMCRDGRCP
jgi:hypothetical protein